MPIRPLTLALFLASLHAAALGQVVKCSDASGRSTWQSMPCAAPQGVRAQNTATPAQHAGSAAAPAKAPVTAEQAGIDAMNARMRVRMCEIHRISLKRLKESDTMLVPDQASGLRAADAARRAAEIAQAEKRVADTCN